MQCRDDIHIGFYHADFANLGCAFFFPIKLYGFWREFWLVEIQGRSKP